MPKSNYGGKRWSQKILKARRYRFNRLSKLTRFLDVGPGIGNRTRPFASLSKCGPVSKCGSSHRTSRRFTVLEEIYDSLVVCDIRYLDWSKVTPLDVAIFGDVLEHMSKEDALNVVETALTHCRVVLVSLPLIHSEQGEVHGNPFEAHVKPDWTNNEALEAFSDWCVLIMESCMGVYFLSRRPDDVKL